VTTINNLDPTARCGFRPLRTYACTVQPAAVENAKSSEPLSDLKCKDGDAHNVYLYVSKKNKECLHVVTTASFSVYGL
jgi:hypothetical protein